MLTSRSIQLEFPMKTKTTDYCDWEVKFNLNICRGDETKMKIFKDNKNNVEMKNGNAKRSLVNYANVDSVRPTFCHLLRSCKIKLNILA